MNIFELIIVQPIFNLLLGIYSVLPGHDFGIALIIFTIIIRFALWPLVVRQLHQVKQMRKLQPELAKIKKATKGNRQLESVQMLELYKKHDVKPFRSILTLLIQLPIFIALYQVIQIFTLHRDQIEKFTYNFVENIAPIKELIAHPELFNEKLLGLVDLTAHAISPTGVNIFLIILALVAAGTQYIITKQTAPTTSTKRFRDVMAEAADGKQPDQSELNAVMMGKMTKFLPFLMLFIMLGLPGALALYYATSNIFAAIQQHYILKRDADEMDKIADEVVVKPAGKKATAKAREKQAREGNVIRISAKETPRSKKGKKS
ncbi:MAG: YidC/Oxa1 family membrane protein insertase [Candidatus Microsaccharimonas sp.]